MESSNGSGLGFKLLCGGALMQASFWGNDLLPEVTTDPEDWAFFYCIWRLVKPSKVGNGNPWINPAKDSSIARLWCSRVLVFDAEEDRLREGKEIRTTRSCWRGAGRREGPRWRKQRKRTMCSIRSTLHVRMLFGLFGFTVVEIRYTYLNSKWIKVWTFMRLLARYQMIYYYLKSQIDLRCSTVYSLEQTHDHNTRLDSWKVYASINRCINVKSKKKKHKP